MMNRFVRRILELGPLLCDLGLSAVGCFVFMRGFRLVAIDELGSDTGLSMSDAGYDAGSPREQFAGTAGALFLLVFVTSEALAMIRAFGR
jgi:hypothetical protein